MPQERDEPFMLYSIARATFFFSHDLIIRSNSQEIRYDSSKETSGHRGAFSGSCKRQYLPSVRTKIADLKGHCQRNSESKDLG